MPKVTIRRKPERWNRQMKKVKAVKFDKGRGGDPKRLAALLNEVMGK